ncbi:MAG: NAD(P)/FAD-dependent oxidoreductase [Methanobacteriaceae archaeon]|jgi:geranylgeranyl reductase family protein|nr:NAD(P)/FAD-dependent oxidoreductase [Methanobacteriaceae archaeon]
MTHDVLIVGAGPVGTTFARYMVEKGFKVGIIEKKTRVGVPLQCAGLLGKQIKEVNILPDELIINPFYGAYLHSPSNHILKVAKGKPEAYVIDRVGYDQFLAEKAVDAGAELFLKQNVRNLDPKSSSVIIGDGKGDFHGKIMVGADGSDSIVSRKLSMGSSDEKQLQAAQLLVDFGSDLFDMDCVHLHAYSTISPGFIWVIPLTTSTARVGLFGNFDYHTLNDMLKRFLDSDQDFEGYRVIKKYTGKIPVYNNKKKIVKDNVLLLGDAASQVKPTTGGGLIIGFKCAQIAANAAEKALEKDDMGILREYNINYGKNFKNELKTQLMVQKIFSSLSDDDLDFMFCKLKEEGAEDIISKYGEMDDQSSLVKELFKRGILFKILPKILTRGLSVLLG